MTKRKWKPPKLGPYNLGPHDPNFEGILNGDALELCDAIPEESVDIILTDPVYSEVEHYRWLALLGAKVLKPDRALLAFYGGPKIWDVHRVMSNHLTWTWNLNYTVVAKANKLIGYNIFTWTTPCLWFRKGKGFPRRRIPDTFISNKRPSSSFKWNKNLEVVEYWLKAFTDPGDVVLDPFAGSGTVAVACKRLGRLYLSTELDFVRAIRARERVVDTHPLPAQLQLEETQ
jgi:site-specific DNA-methyltransferase (adenine-specific)